MGSWIVGTIVFSIIALAARSVYRNHKNGGCASGCDGCASCPGHSGCNPPR